MSNRKALELEASKKIAYRCYGDFHDSTLISLLDEAWSLNLDDSDKIFITYETLPEDYQGDFPEESDLVLRREEISYGELKSFYKKGFGEEYSFVNADDRSKFQMKLWEKQAERRGAWAAYAYEMSFIRAYEKQKKEKQEEREIYDREGQEGVERVRKKREDEDKSGRFLIIN